MDEDDVNTNCTPLDYIFSVEILNEGVEVIERNNKKRRSYAD